MTPIEIFEYKQSWKSDAHIVHMHSDFEFEHKQWCKENVESHRWNFCGLVDNYTNGYMFENKSDAEKFADTFSQGLM